MKRLAKTARPVDSSDSEEDKKKSKNKSLIKKSASPAITNPKTSSKGSFLSLEASMNDVSLRVFKNDAFVCIRDKYPKANTHLLLIPLLPKKLFKVEQVIQMPNAIEFLKSFRTTADEIIEKLGNLKKEQLIIGFHAVQSMQPLHMHIISDDFKSEYLKNKKHWNSFTSDYFIKLDDFINHLENGLDNMKQDYFKGDKFNLKNRTQLDNYLKLDLKCHKCENDFKNIPSLKSHLNTHD